MAARAGAPWLSTWSARGWRGAGILFSAPPCSAAIFRRDLVSPRRPVLLWMAAPSCWNGNQMFFFLSAFRRAPAWWTATHQQARFAAFGGEQRGTALLAAGRGHGAPGSGLWPLAADRGLMLAGAGPPATKVERGSSAWPDTSRLLSVLVGTAGARRAVGCGGRPRCRPCAAIRARAVPRLPVISRRVKPSVASLRAAAGSSTPPKKNRRRLQPVMGGQPHTPPPSGRPWTTPLRSLGTVENYIEPQQYQPQREHQPRPAPVSQSSNPW